MTTSEQSQAHLKGNTVHDRVALVTGGARGIGAATCRELAAGGAHIAVGYGRDRERAEKFVASLAADYPEQRITVHGGNIGVADDCRRGSTSWSTTPGSRSTEPSPR
jgi:NAD(P)-dependent dehydrogenase (short-subunit alcohol dehydrogenase family)